MTAVGIPSPEAGGDGNANQTLDRATSAYQRLRSLIVHGQLAPGSRVVETEVARKLEVSRTPVRSALQRLHQEGFIVGGRGDGLARPMVAPLTREDAHETFEIVAALEGLAAFQVGRLPSLERARVADRLEEANEVLRSLGADGRPNPQRYLDLDNAFHSVYVEAGAGPRLAVLHDSAKAQAERYMRLYVSMLTREISVSADEHLGIIGAIRAGVPDRAHDAVSRNWRNAAERLGRVIDSAGERGTW